MPSSREENRHQRNARSQPSIAIVGTEGSGKTVLLTVLAKRFGRVEDGEWFLNPLTGKTARYVEQNWEALCNGEWPPSTPAGEIVELRWRLRGRSGAAFDLHLQDLAGHDLRRLFAAEEIHRGEHLPDALKAVVKKVESADIAIFLANLKDFIGEANVDQRTANGWAIKYAMDGFRAVDQPRRYCLVLTQVDQYEELTRTHGDWRELVKKYLPYVYEAHIKRGNADIIPVAAVRGTQVVLDDNGAPRRVPSPGFRHSGFNRLMEWLGASIEQVVAEQRGFQARWNEGKAFVHRAVGEGRQRLESLRGASGRTPASLGSRKVADRREEANRTSTLHRQGTPQTRWLTIVFWVGLCLVGGCLVPILLRASH